MKTHLLALALTFAAAAGHVSAQDAPSPKPDPTKPAIPAGELLADLLLTAQEKKVLQHRLFTKRYYVGEEGSNTWLLVGEGSASKEGFRFTLTVEMLTRARKGILDYRFDAAGHLKGFEMTEERLDRKRKESLQVRIVDGVATQTKTRDGVAKQNPRGTGEWKGERISLFSALVLLPSLGDLGLPKVFTVDTCGEDDNIGRSGRKPKPVIVRRETVTTPEGKHDVVLIEDAVRNRPIAKVILGSGKDAGVIREFLVDPKPDGRADLKLRLISDKEVAELRESAPLLMNESKAAAGLRSVYYAQRRFKQEQKNQGQFASSLEELGKGKLLYEKNLVEGTSEGYLILMRRSADGQRSMAVAVPEEVGKTGRYYYVVGPEGKTFRSKKAIELDDACKIPEGLEAVGR